jgi:hypothetical protein
MNDIKIKKINNENIKIIPVPKENWNEIKGYSVIPMLYSNIYICGQKKTGKTNVIFKIVLSCIDKDTKVIVFCSTHNNDSAWIFIKKYFEDNNIQTMFFDSIFENDIDNLEVLLDFMRKEGREEQIEKEKSKKKVSDMLEIIKFDKENNSTKIKIKSKKKKTPKYLIIFDDLSIELKKRNVLFLLKTFRHYQSKVIVSSQFLNDLDPQARQQIDIWLLFKGHPEERLQKIYPDIGCNIDFNKFYEIYEMVTKELHHFMFIDKNSCELRENFSGLIEIKKA